MTSNDWQDIENVRNQAIAQLAEICGAMGLSWSATGMIFTINLPDMKVPRGGKTTLVAMPTKRKEFHISDWGPKGIDEENLQQYRSDPPMQDIIPDNFQMPDYGQILEEGKPPEEGYDEDKHL